MGALPAVLLGVIQGAPAPDALFVGTCAPAAAGLNEAARRPARRTGTAPLA